MIAVFSPGNGVLDGDEFEVIAAASFFESALASAGSLMAGAGLTAPEALGAVTAAEDGDGGTGTAAVGDDTGEAAGGAAVESVVESDDADCAAVESFADTGAGVGAAIGAAPGTGWAEGFTGFGE
jgi:hypothetical protein